MRDEGTPFIIGCVIAGILFVTLLCYLVPEPINNGMIVAKAFSPAHVEHDVFPIVVGDTTVYIPDDTNCPDQWFITIQNEEGRSRQIEVSKEAFDSFDIGSQLSLDGGDKNGND